jgi:hypothetical protein
MCESLEQPLHSGRITCVCVRWGIVKQTNDRTKQAARPLLFLPWGHCSFFFACPTTVGILNSAQRGNPTNAVHILTSQTTGLDGQFKRGHAIIFIDHSTLYGMEGCAFHSE